jgi:hypothetical protein
MRFRHLFPLLALLSLVAVLPASATTYVMVDDADMVDQASAVVDVRIVAVESAPVSGRPSTDYTVEIERLLEGSAPGTSLIVRVPGGIGPDGIGFRAYGMPHFAPGERAILFLAPRGDGTFGLLHLGLGAFHRVESAATPALALRDLEDATEVALPGREPDPRRHMARDFDRFSSWISDRSMGIRRPADYFVEGDVPTGISSLSAKYSLFDVRGFNLRWFEFDSGGRVDWRANQGGQPSLPGGGFNEFRNALQAWNNENRTPINYQYVGETGLRNGLESFDGQNVLLQGDPNNEMPGTFTCGAGGTLAIGGPWFNSDQRLPFKGQMYVPILGADIVMNNGIECLSAGARCYPAYITGVYGHELGHTLAIGHSCGDSGTPSCAGAPTLNDALMRASAHNDCRGARLGSDDIAAARRLYQVSSGSGSRGPAKPSGLTGELATAEVLLDWEDNSTNEVGFRLYRSADGAPFGMIGEVGAEETTFLDDDISPATVYEYRVAAYNARGESSASNTIEVVVPPAVPVNIIGFGLEPIHHDFVVGDTVDFSAHFAGPATHAEWDFGNSDVGFNDEPCSGETFCRSHVFATPGTKTVRVRLTGPFGQVAESDLQLLVEPNPDYATDAEDGFIQWTILGPRGNTGTFRSNVWLHNGGAFPARVSLTYLPRGNEAPPPARTLTIDPSETIFLANVVEKVFGVPSGQGSISIHVEQQATESSPGPRVFAISRSFVELPNKAQGSFGLFVPQQPKGAWTPNAKTATGIIEGDAFISTLLAVNVDDGPGRVEIELFDRDGVPVGDTAIFALGPNVMRFQQTKALFPEVEDRTGPFTARFTSNGIDFLASSTLLETGSEDQIFLAAREPVAEEELILPRVVRSPGQFGVFLTTALSVQNESMVPTDVTFELLERGQANLDPLTANRTVPAGGVLYFEDLIDELFDRETATGALRVRWVNAADVAPRVVALTLSENPQGNTFGMAIDSRSASDAVVDSGVDFGIEQSSRFRSQFGMVNLRAARTDVRLVLRDANGALLAESEIALRPFQHLELNLATIFGDVAAEGENWSVTTEVVSGGPVMPYLANINTSGDVFFVPGEARTGAIEQE